MYNWNVKKFINFFNNNYVFYKNKELIVDKNDYKNVQAINHKLGHALLEFEDVSIEVKYFSKLSKRGFEYLNEKVKSKESQETKTKNNSQIHLTKLLNRLNSRK